VSPEELASKLVSEYPEHGFVISRDEASALGLQVANAEDHPRWAKFKSLNTLVSWKRKETFVRVLSDDELDKDDEDDVNGKDNSNDDKSPTDDP
jgi:hypothetical protein